MSERAPEIEALWTETFGGPPVITADASLLIQILVSQLPCPMGPHDALPSEGQRES